MGQACTCVRVCVLCNVRFIRSQYFANLKFAVAFLYLLFASKLSAVSFSHSVHSLFAFLAINNAAMTIYQQPSQKIE